MTPYLISIRISMIHTQIMTNFKVKPGVKNGSILIEYYKSLGSIIVK